MSERLATSFIGWNGEKTDIRATAISDTLIAEIQALEEKAANWDLLEKLPNDSGLVKDNRGLWILILNSIKTDLANTPAEALKAYWDSKKENEIG